MVAERSAATFPPMNGSSGPVDLYGLRTQQIVAALAYYAEFTDEIDTEIATNAMRPRRRSGCGSAGGTSLPGEAAARR